MDRCFFSLHHNNSFWINESVYNMLCHVVRSLVRSFTLFLSSTTFTWINTTGDTTLIFRFRWVYKCFAEKWTSAPWYVYFQYTLFIREIFITKSRNHWPIMKNKRASEQVYPLPFILKPSVLVTPHGVVSERGCVSRLKYERANVGYSPPRR